MRNERGPKKTGRTGSSAYKGKTSAKRGDDKNPKEFKKPGSKSRFAKPKGDSDKPFKKTTDGPSFAKKKTGSSDFADSKPYKRNTGPKKEGSFDNRGGKKWEDRRERPTNSRGPYKKKFGTDRDSTDKPERKTYTKKPFTKREGDFNSYKPRFAEKGPFKKKFDSSSKEDGSPRPPKKTGSYADYKKKGSGSNFEERKEYKRKTGIKTYTDKNDPEKTYTKETEIVRNKNASKSFKKVKVFQKDKDDDGLIRLNKFIANAGICSRREADTFIQTGVVTVNGVVITELGYKVKPDDKVLFGDRPIAGEKLVYILLNKPKDYITTSKDPQNRKTVYELVSGVKERIFPVGRLDRNTTGVLLLTNDGVLAEKLMHPRKGVAKIYHVELDKRFSAPDLEHMRKGIELEDGFFTPDEVDYVDGMDKHHVGIEIHSGKNRIVRRLFESLNYEVVKLDRVVYAGLTKKGLTRGKWRFLKDSELHALKMM